MEAAGSWAGMHVFLLRMVCEADRKTESPTSFAPLMEDLARQSKAALVFVCYSTAPEKTFPYQFEQTYRALDYIVRYGHKHSLAVDSVVLAGDSVGGTYLPLTHDN